MHAASSPSLTTVLQLVVYALGTDAQHELRPLQPVPPPVPVPDPGVMTIVCEEHRPLVSYSVSADEHEPSLFSCTIALQPICSSDESDAQQELSPEHPVPPPLVVSTTWQSRSPSRFVCAAAQALSSAWATISLHVVAWSEAVSCGQQVLSDAQVPLAPDDELHPAATVIATATRRPPTIIFVAM